MADSPQDVETIGFEEFMSIMHEEPNSLLDFPDYSQLKASTGESDREDPPSVAMPPFGDDTSNFELGNEADSGEAHGLLGTGQPGYRETLDTSLSDGWKPNVCKTLQVDRLCETPPSSSSDLYQHFESAPDLDLLTPELAVDSERPQQRDGSVLASDWVAPAALENDTFSHVPAGNSMDSVRAIEIFGSFMGNCSIQNTKLNADMPREFHSGRSYQYSPTRELVDLTQTDSSEGEMEVGSREFGNFSRSNDVEHDVRRKLPSWGEPSKKNIRKNGLKDISQRNSTFTEASDWNSRKMAINGQERRIVGLQFQGGSGTVLTSIGKTAEKEPVVPVTFDQHGVFGFEEKHVKDEWKNGSIYSYQKSGSANLDSENQKPILKGISYCNDESDTEAVLDCTTERRYLPSTFGPGRSMSNGAGQHIPPWNNAGLWTKGEDGKQMPRPKSDDEMLTYRAVLQDLAQPKQEVTPDAGLLAVPLLRHQRIALAWMVQKETNSMQCAGGILADDQGLGKTVSTIALILKERPPTYKSSCEDSRNIKPETSAVNLDEDDVEVTDFLGDTSDHKVHDSTIEENYCKKEVLSVKRGRPSAGTLVVCPTSVLRQWAQEIRDKVTTKANLSLLVYHGSNRTKDPDDLARYDVVLTTYSIVSMEVPKQELTDERDDDERNPDDYGLCDFPSYMKKKKKPSETVKKGSKSRKGTNDSSSDPSPRPLARVSWFRVVLDEAQSIKNHRTQVARACWSLRAKRRWCLSGTPIQNAIDDLYSYFRFLKYDPYAVYKSFCSTIKLPIARNPISGYKKLQAVLKTIMLRRTKGTVIDGEPIVKLPPKTITLRKVDFTLEERAFYSRLEAESRAQFKVYAAAGTVKQNYVNILLMLLRLRQACDHPHLVKHCSTDSTWSSSAETARNLPREKQIDLMNRLEGSLAICGICNDAPEEAVVTVCGHVFCNQCISEHLTQADDTHCPSPQCKCLLKPASVFSLTTLKNCTSDDHGNDEMAESMGQASEPESYLQENVGVYSSKIKAALEVLRSLPKLCTSISKSTDSGIDRDLGSAHGQTDGIVEDSTSDRFDKVNPDSQPSLKKQILETSEKAIVFSQWTTMLDLLESPLRKSSIQYRRLDGTMSVLARDRAINDFRTLPEVTVMIMSLKAASLGLNMVSACHVLLLDLWWNPTTEDQAIDRAHRIGQTRPVSVSRFTVKDTVEDRILALQERKREMVASAFGEDEAGGRQTRLTEDDLRYLFMV